MCVYSSYQTNPNSVFSTHFLSLYPVKGFPVEFEIVPPIPDTQCQKRDREKNPGIEYFIDPIEEETRTFLGEKVKKDISIGSTDSKHIILMKNTNVILKLITKHGYDAKDILLVNYQHKKISIADLNDKMQNMFDKGVWKVPTAVSITEFLNSENKNSLPCFSDFTNCPQYLKGLETKVLIVNIGESVDFEKLETVYCL